MNIPDPLFNRAGRLRSGWRLAVFAVAYLIALSLLAGLARAALAAILSPAGAESLFESDWGYVVQAAIIFSAAALLGWACGYVFEDLPWRALGWALHKGWARDLLVGSVVGAASITLAAGLAALPGGLRFTPAGTWPTTIETLTLSAFVFALSAAAEEVLFRGYPLQTVVRSWPAWAAVIPSSAFFAAAHLANPNAVPGFTFINTALAGVWLAVAYLRTRSLWLPLGLHWSWNWAMGALLGLPVSGITQLAPAPLVRARDLGPAWLTGGHYGIEGGAACTVALLLSTAFLWRAPFLRADDELKRWTDAENPNPDARPLTIRE